jgi:tetratricopeptide (TPR) repeat protein
VLCGAVLTLPACAEIADLAKPAPPSPVVEIAAANDVGTDASNASGSAFGAYLAGLYAGRQQDLASAADFMLQALASDPSNEQLLERSFVLAASDGRRAEAVELARRLAAVNPEQAMAGLVRAGDAAARGNLDEADAVLADLPEKGLSTVSTPLLRSWIDVAKGNIDAALERAAPLRNRDGFGVFYSLHVALVNDVAGRIEAAKTAYDEALEASGKPTLRLAMVAGNFFERAGDGERAAEIYRDMAARGPDSTFFQPALERIAAGTKPKPLVASATDGMADALFNLASLLSQERADELALVHAHVALWLQPDFELTYMLIGEVLQGQERRSEAVTVYRRIPADSPFSWMARLRISEELEGLDRIDEASAELESLAAARPDSFEPLYRLGNLLRGKERFAEAVAAYDRAAARVGKPESRYWSLFYFRGISLERLSDWSRAEKDLLLALELEPDQPFVLNYLAYTWVDRKLNLDRAKSMLVRAVELRPDDGYIVDSLGWVYYRLGDYQEGVKQLERAVELRPQDPVINDHLGDAYWRVGRHQEARFQWRRSLHLGPDADLVPTIQGKIQNGLKNSPTDT